MAMCEAKGFRPCERDELMTLVNAEADCPVAGQNAQLAGPTKSKQLGNSASRSARRLRSPRAGGPPAPSGLGRKPGQGMFSYRKLPSPDQVTEPIVEVTVPGDHLRCGGRPHEGVGDAYVMTFLRSSSPTAYRVQVCRCRSCGRPVRGRHPDVAPDQYGASGTGLRRVMAADAPLLGGRVRKVPAVLRALTGVSITQDALRRRCGGGSLPEAAGFGASPFVHTDDNGVWAAVRIPDGIRETEPRCTRFALAPAKSARGGSVGLWRSDGADRGYVPLSGVEVPGPRAALDQ